MATKAKPQSVLEKIDPKSVAEEVADLQDYVATLQAEIDETQLTITRLQAIAAALAGVETKSAETSEDAPPVAAKKPSQPTPIKVPIVPTDDHRPMETRVIDWFRGAHRDWAAPYEVARIIGADPVQVGAYMSARPDLFRRNVTSDGVVYLLR